MIDCLKIKGKFEIIRDTIVHNNVMHTMTSRIIDSV